MTDQRTGVRVLRCIVAAMAIALPCAYADRADTSFETHIRTGDSALERVTRERLSGKARADALREAAESYTYVIDNGGDDILKIKALERRVIVQYASRDCIGAIRDATRLIQHSAVVSAETYKIRGHCYLVEGRYADAITEYGRAIALGETDPEIYRSRGDAYAALGKDQKAVRDFSSYLERYPQRDVFEARGDAYVRLGQYAAARKDYQLALNKAVEADRELRWDRTGGASPGLVYYKSKIGQTFLWEGNAARARGLYRELIDAAPESYEGYLGIAEVELVEEDPQRVATALEMASKAVSLSRGRDPDALAALAEAAFRGGDTASAVSVINRAITLRPHEERFAAARKRYIGEAKAEQFR